MAVPYVLESWVAVEELCPDGTLALCLKGRVFGHPRFSSADSVTTSAIVSYREEGSVLIVASRSGSEYVLSRPLTGKPFAKKRLLRQLAERRCKLLPADPKSTRTSRFAVTPEWVAAQVRAGEEDEERDGPPPFDGVAN
jgi:hypothetical protein